MVLLPCFALGQSYRDSPAPVNTFLGLDVGRESWDKVFADSKEENAMAMREYKVEFEFTSNKPYGDNYTRVMVVKADSPASAECAARRRAFSEFGAAFTDNCVDWRALL